LERGLKEGGAKRDKATRKHRVRETSGLLVIGLRSVERLGFPSSKSLGPVDWHLITKSNTRATPYPISNKAMQFWVNSQTHSSSHEMNSLRSKFSSNGARTFGSIASCASSLSFAETIVRTCSFRLSQQRGSFDQASIS